MTTQVWQERLGQNLCDLAQCENNVQVLASNVDVTSDEAFRFLLLVAEHKGWTMGVTLANVLTASTMDRVMAVDVRRKLSGKRPRLGAPTLFWKA